MRSVLDGGNLVLWLWAMTQSRVSYLSTEYVEMWVFVYSLLFWVWHGGSGYCMSSLLSSLLSWKGLDGMIV